MINSELPTGLRRPCTPSHPRKSAPHHRDFLGTPGIPPQKIRTPPPRFPGDPGHPTPENPHPTTAISWGPRGSRGPASPTPRNLRFRGDPGTAVLSYALFECAPSGPRRRTTIWRTWPENHDAADGTAVRSSCWLEHDLMAEYDLQLMDEVADLALVVHPGDVGVGSEIAETGSRVRKQVPHDDQDGAGHGNQCLELARALDETSVAFSREGVG